MTNPMQSDPDRLRLALDNGEEVELDGGTYFMSSPPSADVNIKPPSTIVATTVTA